MVAGLLGLLIWLIIFAVVFGVIYYALSILTVPEPIRKIVLLVVGAIGLIILLEKLVPLIGHLGLALG